jgi:hypothetical protein
MHEHYSKKQLHSTQMTAHHPCMQISYPPYLHLLCHCCMQSPVCEHMITNLTAYNKLYHNGFQGLQPINTLPPYLRLLSHCCIQQRLTEGQELRRHREAALRIRACRTDPAAAAAAG